MNAFSISLDVDDLSKGAPRRRGVDVLEQGYGACRKHPEVVFSNSVAVMGDKCR